MKKIMSRHMAKLLFPALVVPLSPALDTEEQQMLITWLQLGCSFLENPFSLFAEDGSPLNFLDALHRAQATPTCNWQEIFLQVYLETQPGVPREYVHQFLDWVHSGHSIYSNPWGICEEDAVPMNYLDAIAFLEETAWEESTEDNRPCDLCSLCRSECRNAGFGSPASGSTNNPELPF